MIRDVALFLVLAGLASWGVVCVLAFLAALRERDHVGVALWAGLWLFVNVLGVTSALALVGKL